MLQDILLENRENGHVYDSTSVEMIFHPDSPFKTEIRALFPTLSLLSGTGEDGKVCGASCNSLNCMSFLVIVHKHLLWSALASTWSMVRFFFNRI